MCASRLRFDFHVLQDNSNYIITFPTLAKTKSNTHPVSGQSNDRQKLLPNKRTVL